MQERKYKKEESSPEQDEDEQERKPVFSAEAIKRIGYDPSAKRGQFSKEEDQKRVGASLRCPSGFHLADNIIQLGTIATLENLSTGCRMERAAKRLKEEKLAAKTRPPPKRQSNPLSQATSNPSQSRHIDTLTKAGGNKDSGKINVGLFNIAKQQHGPKIRLPTPLPKHDGDDGMIDLD